MAIDFPKLLEILRKADAEVDEREITTEVDVRAYLLARTPERIEYVLLDLVGIADAEFVAAAARELRQVTGPTARQLAKDAERHGARVPSSRRAPSPPPAPPRPLTPPEPPARQAEVKITSYLMLYLALQAGADLVRQGNLLEAHAIYSQALQLYAQCIEGQHVAETPTLHWVALEGMLVVTNIVLDLVRQINESFLPRGEKERVTREASTISNHQLAMEELATQVALRLDATRDTGDMAMLRSLGPIALIAELTQLQAENSFQIAKGGTDHPMQAYQLAFIHARNAEGWFTEELRRQSSLPVPAQDFLRARVAIAYRLGSTVHSHVYNPPPEGSVDPVVFAGTMPYPFKPGLPLRVSFSFLMLRGIDIPIVVAQPARSSPPRVEPSVPQSGPVLADLIDIWFTVEQAMSDIESGKLLKGLQGLDNASILLIKVANQEVHKRNIPCALVSYTGALLLVEEVKKTWSNKENVRAHFEATSKPWSEETYAILARSMTEKESTYRGRIDELSKIKIPGLPSEETLRRFGIDGIFMDLFLHTAQLNQSYARWVEGTNPDLSVKTLADVIETLYFAAARSTNILDFQEASLTPHTGNYLLAVFQQAHREARRVFEHFEVLGDPVGPVQRALPVDQIPAFRATYERTLPMASARFEMFEEEMQRNPLLRTESSFSLPEFADTNWWLASSLTQLGEALQGSIVINPGVFSTPRTSSLETAFLLVRPDGTRIDVNFSDVESYISFRVDPQAFADDRDFLRLAEDTVARINELRDEVPFVATPLLIFDRNNTLHVYERNDVGVFVRNQESEMGEPGGSAAPASGNPAPQGNPGGSQTKGVMNHAPTTDLRNLLLRHGLDLDVYTDLLDADVVGPELQAEALALLNRTDIDRDQMEMDLQDLMEESGDGEPRRATARVAPTGQMARVPMAARLMRKV